MEAGQVIAGKQNGEHTDDGIVYSFEMNKSLTLGTIWLRMKTLFT